MGFKCPNCHKDFGIDKTAWQEHIKFCGDAVDMVNIYTTTDKEQAMRSLEKLKRKYEC